MMRLTPRSLKGQLIALTSVALLASQIAGFVVHLNDKESALTAEWFRNILTRTVTVADIIDQTPAEFHKKILKTTNTGALRYSVDAEPLTAGEPLKQDSGLSAQLPVILQERAAQARLTVYPRLNEASRMELLFGDLWRDLRKTLFPRNRFMPGAPARPTYAHLSVRLKSGEWLNVTVLARFFAPPAYPLLVQWVTLAVFSALGIVALIGRVIRPLKELETAAETLGRGQRIVLAEEGPREVASAMRAFNEMQERLIRFVDDRTKMLAALGHDLRTPITSLRLRAEFIEEDDIRDKIIETLDEMQQMAEATLSFAHQEAGQEAEKTLDLSVLTEAVCLGLRDAGLEVKWQVAGGVFVRCKPVGLKRALRNIIVNAVSYGHRARVSLTVSDNRAIVCVDDDGPGIPDDDLDTVFKPFVRLEGSRSRETGGVGLGLAIAQSTLRGQGGDITLHNRFGGGLRARLSLPLTALPALPAPAPANAAAA